MRKLFPIIYRPKPSRQRQETKIKDVKGAYLYLAVISMVSGNVAYASFHIYSDVSSTLSASISIIITAFVYYGLQYVYSFDKLSLPVEMLNQHKTKSSSIVSFLNILENSQTQLYTILDGEGFADEMNESEIYNAMSINEKEVKRFLSSKGVKQTEEMFHQLREQNASVYDAMMKYNSKEYDRLAISV